jgi:hypothetical protein
MPREIRIPQRHLNGRGRDNEDPLKSIAGQWNSPLYTGGEDDSSAQAFAVRQELESITGLDNLTDAQLSRLERVLAGGLAGVREESIRRQFEVFEWQTGQGPSLDLDPDPDIARFCFNARMPKWLDHPSKLIHKETGEIIYRSEPYWLNEKELRQLVALVDAGWRVRICPEYSTHFPGETMAIMVRKPKPAPQEDKKPESFQQQGEER